MATIRQFDFSVNLLQSILWQYNSALNVQAILQSKQNWYNENQQSFWENWITDVFDLRTANEFGLVVWAIILGIPLTYISPPTPNGIIPFGFDSFNLSNFGTTSANPSGFNFASDPSLPIQLTLEEKRLILQLRYRQLVSRGTVTEVNKILADLLVPTYGAMYMVDGFNMTENLVCLEPIGGFISFLFSQYDILPRPAGVKLIVIDGTFPLFGFGSETLIPNTYQNFTNGGFTPFL